MAGSMLIAYILPLCHLSMALRYSRTNSPRFVAGIYPLIGFKSPLELFKDPAISKSITMRTRYASSKISFGFLSPTAPSFQEFFLTDTAVSILNTCVVWLPPWRPTAYSQNLSTIFHVFSAHGVLLSELFA